FGTVITRPGSKTSTQHEYLRPGVSRVSQKEPIARAQDTGLSGCCGYPQKYVGSVEQGPPDSGRTTASLRTSTMASTTILAGPSARARAMEVASDSVVAGPLSSVALIQRRCRLECSLVGGRSRRIGTRTPQSPPRRRSTRLGRVTFVGADSVAVLLSGTTRRLTAWRGGHGVRRRSAPIHGSVSDRAAATRMQDEGSMHVNEAQLQDPPLRLFARRVYTTGEENSMALETPSSRYS
ncbi:hypothetical protein B0H21DRAFT_40953, partial [Amylocystis lapponica]